MLPADKVLLFKKLFKEDLNNVEKEEVCAFFETYNVIAEDWMHFGGEHLLRPNDPSNPRQAIDKHAYDVIVAIKERGLPIRQ